MQYSSTSPVPTAGSAPGSGEEEEEEEEEEEGGGEEGGGEEDEDEDAGCTTMPGSMMLNAPLSGVWPATASVRSSCTDPKPWLIIDIYPLKARDDLTDMLVFTVHRLKSP
jgi:hypothetical protein